MMRHQGVPFCAVCSQQIRRMISPYHRIAVSFAPWRFTHVHDYAVLNGFVGGFPNFHEADWGGGLVFGSILLHSGSAEWRDIFASDLGNPASFEDRFRAVNDYASANGFASGYPTFHEADYGQGTVYGCILISGDAVEWRDVPVTELGLPSGGIAPRFQAVHDYAYNNGFVGGFPNFHEADYGQGTVYGCLLLKGPAAEWRDIPVRDFCGTTQRLNDAAAAAQSVPLAMRTRQTERVTVQMRNTGTATWTTGAG